ncbi:MAG: glycosyltransferase family 39 protein [Pseudomonadota bacterium]
MALSNTVPAPLPRADYLRWLLWLALAVFAGGLIYNFVLLEADRLPFFLNGTSFGDEVGFAHSARIKYLHGVWFRPDLDDWRPIFLIPLHSFLVWLGFELAGLTLTGLRLNAFFFMALTKGVICFLVWRQYKNVGYLIASLLLVTLLPPLNEMSRTGAVDSGQTGLMALTLLCLVSARDGQTRLRYLLAGVFCGLAFCYKLSAFLWPLFPYAFLQARWRLSLEPTAEPAAEPAAEPWRPWARWLLCYAPTLYLLLDTFVLGSDRSFNLGLLLWPLLPLLYFLGDMALMARRAMGQGQPRGRWAGACWIIGNLLLWGLLAAKALGSTPGQGLMLLRNLLPLIVLAGFAYYTWLRHGWRGLACGDPAALGWTHLGLGLTMGLALVLWIIPHLDGAMYFSWRMFGTSGRLLLPAFTREVTGNLFNLLNVKVGAPEAWATLDVHSAWLFGLLAWLMVYCLQKRRGADELDVAMVIMAGLFFFQCVVYDMSWHRYYALMTLGYLGLLRLMHAALNWRRVELAQRPGPLAVLTFGFAFYLLITRLAHPLLFKQAHSLFWLLAGLWVAGGLLFWLLLRQRARAALLVLGLAGLLLLPVNLHHAWRYFFDVTHTVRQASQELGQKLGEARTPGFYELSLYNRTEAGYIGNFRGQVKPDGFYFEGRHVDSLYQAVQEARPRSLGARILWRLDALYPGFLKAWELPPDYRQRYHSDWIVATPDRPSPRHLIIGASEPKVYMQKEMYDFLLERSVSAPALTGEEVTVPQPRHMLVNRAPGGRDEPGPAVIRLVRLDPVRRVAGELKPNSPDNPEVDVQ